MPKRTDIKKILVIGSGPIVIGQAAEFDYAGTQACLALKRFLSRSSEMVGVAQLVRAPDCGSGCRGFESLYPPHTKRRKGRSFGSGPYTFLSIRIQGCSQVVRQGTLTPSLAGSSPAIPATFFCVFWSGSCGGSPVFRLIDFMTQ